MLKMITRAKQFESGSSAIQEAETNLMQKDFEEQKQNEKRKGKVTAVSDNLKFGRGNQKVASHL